MVGAAKRTTQTSDENRDHLQLPRAFKIKTEQHGFRAEFSGDIGPMPARGQG
jgi:hypothetical protein